MRVLLVSVALVALVGCSSNHGSGELARLRRTAALDPCPVTATLSAKLPNLTLRCLGTGPRVQLRGLVGLPTLVNVWGSWCAPCQREVPALQAVYAAAHGRLRVLGVDTEDDQASALDFAAHVGMRYPSVVDDDGAFIRSLGKNATPMTLFLDAAGDVLHTKYGQFHGLADIKLQLRHYLGLQV